MRRALKAALLLAPLTAAGTLPAQARLTLAEICEAKGSIRVRSSETELLTGPEVLNHLPGPSATDFGDMRIGTADDAIHPGLTVPPDPDFGPAFGCPNDLAGGSAVPSITCGVAGSPGTKLLHGTSAKESQESVLHSPEEDQLSLAREGHGAYSFAIATVGNFRSISYLTGHVSGVISGFSGTIVELFVVNITLGGTTLVPNVFFQGPFNVDLLTIGPGGDLKYDGFRDDDKRESIARGCNGLARGVDGLDPLGNPIDWQPVSPGPFPKFPDFKRSNRGVFQALSDPAKGGRLTMASADVIAKVPSSAAFFVVQDSPFAGYLFPIDEAEALTTPLFRRGTENLADLPDIPGFPDSGEGLATYFVEVLTPKAHENPDNRLVGFLRGQTTIEIIGVETTLDTTVAVGGTLDAFDLCLLDVSPCTF